MGITGRRMVVFDVEGVLLPKRRFLLFDVAPKLGLSTFLKCLFIGIFYEIGLVSIESALKRLFRLLKGVPIDELFSHFRRLSPINGAAELFSNLRELGFKTVLISSGLPRVFVEDIAKRLGADCASGLEVGIDSGRLTGEIWGDVLKPHGKAVALEKSMETEELSSYDRIVVADDRNNLPLFRLCRVRIGYNPDFILSAKSDYVVKGGLSKLLPLISGTTSRRGDRSLSRSDILHESIHIGGILVPFVSIHLLGDYTIAFLIAVVTSIYTISEILRVRGKRLPIISTVTLEAADKSELQEFVTAPISYAIGMMLSLLAFRPPVSYASIATLTLGDGFAAVFGRRFGRSVIPVNKGKKIEGSIAGFIFAFLGCLLFVDPLRALVGAFTGILAECLPSPIDDNIAIPLVSGLAVLLAF